MAASLVQRLGSRMAVPKYIETLLSTTKVLVVDDEVHMRKVIRALLLSLGIQKIDEAIDGASGLEAIIASRPDIVIVDWEMPLLSGPEFVRCVRSPETFPLPDVPIIMLTGHMERKCVIEAIEAGVNEYVCKPVSGKTLLDRILSVRTSPRPNVKLGNYYGPTPRKFVTDMPVVDTPGALTWV
ncbi:MAG: response regulator [Pseudorhodoplanes sp.]